jgi:hypothetical protein
MLTSGAWVADPLAQATPQAPLRRPPIGFGLHKNVNWAGTLPGVLTDPDHQGRGRER